MSGDLLVYQDQSKETKDDRNHENENEKEITREKGRRWNLWLRPTFESYFFHLIAIYIGIHGSEPLFPNL